MDTPFIQRFMAFVFGDGLEKRREKTVYKCYIRRQKVEERGSHKRRESHLTYIMEK